MNYWTGALEVCLPQAITFNKMKYSTVSQVIDRNVLPWRKSFQATPLCLIV